MPILHTWARLKTSLIDKDNTTIVDGKGDKDKITARVNQIKCPNRNYNQRLRPRKITGALAKLSGGVAVLYVGAATKWK